MKLSRYNTYINVSPRLGCIYNALSDKTVVFSGNAEDIGRQKRIPMEFKERFIESGVLVDEDLDEYDDFVTQARNAEIGDTCFHLLVNPTLSCNFHCHYCYETHGKSKMDTETLSRLQRLISNRLSEGKDLIMSFFGGEPTLYFEDIMKPLISHAMETADECGRDFHCNMTSNGYLLNEERVLWLAAHRFTGAQITLDGSKELHNAIRYRFQGDNTYDRIVENIRLLVRYGMDVTLRLNSTHANIESLASVARSFSDLDESERRRITVDLQVVWQEPDRETLIDRMDTIVTSFMEGGILASKMDFSGFCYADRRNSCLINYNGDVFKCTARDFSAIPRDGFLNEEGEVTWENDSLERRMQAKFSNPFCRECRIFPLCHGGCSTNSLENRNYCMHDFSEESKDRTVRNRIVYNANRSKVWQGI